MTKYEGAVISAYTGVLIGCPKEFHKYAEIKLKRSFYMHEFKKKEVKKELREKSFNNFIDLHLKIINPQGN